MKNIYFIIITLLLSSFFIQAQCDVTNGSFNMSTCGNASEAFTLGCVQGWNTSHGSPSIFGSGSTTRTWMWGNYGRGEGIYTNYNFVIGETYKIKFKINKTSAFTIIPNSKAIFRAVSGLNPSSTTTFPSMPSGSELVYSSLMATDINAGEKSVSFDFTATANNSQLWIYPQNPSNGRQVNLEIDDLSITKKAVTSVFHFQDENGQVKNSFLCNEDIYLKGTASEEESQYYIDFSRRPIGSTTSFAWQQRLGASGWTIGQVGVLNLTQIFINQNYEFESGYEYQVKLATSKPPCVNWVETTHTFTVTKPQVSTAFTCNTFSAIDGTVRVEVVGASNVFGGTHWWRIFETTVVGSISGANTIGAVTVIKGGTTAVFNGLSKNKNYYVKHGVFDGINNCIGWVEARKAFRVYSKKSLGEKSSYEIEKKEEAIDVSLVEDAGLLYPNPTEKGVYSVLKVDTKNIKAIYVNNVEGNRSKEVKFEKVDQETIRFVIDDKNFIKGINFIKILKNDGRMLDEKLIVK